MVIVTSGARYIDIDAYACAVAYAELLRLLGEDVQAASTATWNESISQSMIALHAPFVTEYQASADDNYIIVDVSDPTQFDKIVDVDRVAEVLDHHPGFEEYWTDRIADKSRIDFIGAAATLIYERWAATDMLEHMSKESAELLAAAILDNTLNFGAGVTTERDKDAYKFLSEHASLDDAWLANYFTECQEAIVADLAESLRNDTKFLKFSGLQDELCLGQMVVWDAKSIIASELNVISDTLGNMRGSWLANLVSISEGRSYFLSDNDEVKQWLEPLVKVKFDGELAVADRLWLRKEIMKMGL